MAFISSRRIRALDTGADFSVDLSQPVHAFFDLLGSDPSIRQAEARVAALQQVALQDAVIEKCGRDNCSNTGVPLISISGYNTIGSGNNPQWCGDNTIHLADGFYRTETGAQAFQCDAEVDQRTIRKHV